MLQSNLLQAAVTTTVSPWVMPSIMLLGIILTTVYQFLDRRNSAKEQARREGEAKAALDARLEAKNQRITQLETRVQELENEHTDQVKALTGTLQEMSRILGEMRVGQARTEEQIKALSQRLEDFTARKP